MIIYQFSTLKDLSSLKRERFFFAGDFQVESYLTVDKLNGWYLNETNFTEIGEFYV